jgi:hypothetical protein
MKARANDEFALNIYPRTGCVGESGGGERKISPSFRDDEGKTVMPPAPSATRALINRHESSDV